MSDLAELFSRDPNKCTKDDVRSIIAAYRERRKQFNLGSAQAGSVKPLKGKAAESAKAVTADVDL
jgi:hypothetical protein